jgi:hypothetical protein
MSKPTPEQMEHFYVLQTQGIITSANLQGFLQKPDQFVNGFSTTFDQALGLPKLIQLAVGKKNLSNINSDITSERFKLVGTGVRTVVLELAPFLDGETGEQAAKRLVSEGYTLENTGELAGFLHQYPAEVEKCGIVVALGEDSRWTYPGGDVDVPCAYVHGANRDFSLDWFDDRFSSDDRVLVSRPSK